MLRTVFMRFLSAITMVCVFGLVVYRSTRPEPAEKDLTGNPAPLGVFTPPPVAVPLSLDFDETRSTHRIRPVFVLPNDTVDFEVEGPSGPPAISARSSGGQLLREDLSEWQWVAPGQHGVYSIEVRDSLLKDPVSIHAFVLVPFEHSTESLNGYKIGRYMAAPLRNDPAYLRPSGFVEVTEANKETPVSTHFRLGQFVAKQGSEYPKYLVLKEELILKLEAIVEQLHREGFPVKTLHVMSGFRTPYYNQMIGNETSYSRHLYGDAADIFVDMDGDNHMDDLTKDGQVNRFDAEYLADLVVKAEEESGYPVLPGGIGIYEANAAHGPFVHVDTRGKPARW